MFSVLLIGQIVKKTLQFPFLLKQPILELAVLCIGADLFLFRKGLAPKRFENRHRLYLLFLRYGRLFFHFAQTVPHTLAGIFIVYIVAIFPGSIIILLLILPTLRLFARRTAQAVVLAGRQKKFPTMVTPANTYIPLLNLFQVILQRRIERMRNDQPLPLPEFVRIPNLHFGIL